MPRSAIHLVLVAGLMAATAPADAAAGSACVSAVTWTFSPPLTTDFVTGTVRLDHTGICAVADGGPSLIRGGSGTDTATFTGSCAIALISSVHYDATVLAGTGVVQIYQNASALAGATVTVGTADAPCAVSRLSGLAVGVITHS